MAPRLRLRVCTWNVGNAQPPADLTEWLGASTDEYDIVAVAAQEANFGAEKMASPTSITRVETPSEEPPKPVPFTPSARPLRRLSRALRSVRRSKSRVSTLCVESPQPLSKQDHNENCEEQQEFLDGFEATVHADQTKEMTAKRIPPALRPADSSSRNTTLENTASSIDTKNGDETSWMPREKSLTSKASSAKSTGHSAEGIEQFPSKAPLGFLCNSSDSDSLQEDLPQRPQRRATYGAKDDRSAAEKKDVDIDCLKRRKKVNMLSDRNAEESYQGPTSARKFSRAVEANMSSQYRLIAKHHLMEIKLLIFVHERIESRVSKTETMAEATGLGNVVGNKGGVAVKMTIDDTSFCFVSSHLAAHEGAKFLQQRNDDVVEIMRNIERDKAFGLPVIHQFDHVFWMGDLNYRLDPRLQIPAAVRWSHEERFQHVVDLIEHRQFTDLAGLDELRHEMAVNTVFGGFCEGTLAFSPTFKVKRGTTGIEYQTMRVPAYCDRILWHSQVFHKEHVRQREYSCVERINSSDHKPVFATFDIVIPKPAMFSSLPAPRHALKCTLDFLQLEVHGLYEKRGDEGEQERPMLDDYVILEDGALALRSKDSDNGIDSGNGMGHALHATGCAATSPLSSAAAGHTRRVVTAHFHGGGVFVKEKAHRAEVPLREGQRVCKSKELPRIPLRPVLTLGDLMFKYVTIVFSRMGSRQGSSCSLPLAWLIQLPGRHRLQQELELTKYGTTLAKVKIDVELVMSLETWIDSKNKVVKARI